MQKLLITLSRFLARLLVALTGLSLVAAILAIFYYMWFAEENWVLGVYLALFFGLPTYRLLQALAEKPNQGLSVLYLRRFGGGADVGDSTRRNRSMERLLVTACRGLATPVTLRDASLPEARSLREGVTGALAILFFLLMASTMFFLVEYVFDGDPFRPGRFMAAVFFLAFGVMAAGMLGLRAWLLRHAGSEHPVDTQSMVAQLRRIIRRRASHLELLVYQASDDNWQERVEALLSEVSVVIVDITRGTESLDWESRLALEILGPERVLFVKNRVGKEVVYFETTGLPRLGPAGEYHLLNLDFSALHIEAVDRGGVESSDTSIARFVCASVLRNWIEHRCLAGPEAVLCYQLQYKNALLRAGLALGLAYGVIAFLCVVRLYLDRKIPPGLVHYGVAAMAGLLTFLVARAVFSSAPVEYSLVGAAMRGAATAAISYVCFILFLLILSVVYPAVPTDDSAGGGYGVVMVFLLVTTVLMAFAGAVLGPLVELLVTRLRRPSKFS